MPTTRYWLPTTALTPVDALNRAFLATGSASDSVKGMGADYNGHRYEATPGRTGGYSVSYFWAGLHWVGRGVSLHEATRLLKHHARRGRGGSGLIELRPTDDTPEVVAMLTADGFVPYDGPKTAHDHFATTMPWQCGGRWHGHTSTAYAFEAVRMEREQGVPTDLFLRATSYEDWMAKVEAFRAARRADRGVTA